MVILYLFRMTKIGKWLLLSSLESLQNLVCSNGSVSRKSTLPPIIGARRKVICSLDWSTKKGLKAKARIPRIGN